MTFDDDTLSGIMVDIWSSLVQDEALGDVEPVPVTGARFAARVVIDGDAAAIVDIDVSANPARRLAAAMFHQAGDDEATCDAVGELCNQFAGAVKGFLPGECHLHVPTAAWTVEDGDVPAAYHVLGLVTWALADGHVTARIWGSPQDAA